MSFIDEYLAGIEREKAPPSVRELEITVGTKGLEGIEAYFAQFFNLPEEERKIVRRYASKNGLFDFYMALIRVSELSPRGLDNLNLEELRERIRAYIDHLPNREKTRYLNDERLGFLRAKRRR